MAKNKVVFKDKETGMKWWITKKGKIFPTNWKLQCPMNVFQVDRSKIKPPKGE